MISSLQAISCASRNALAIALCLLQATSEKPWNSDSILDLQLNAALLLTRNQVIVSNIEQNDIETPGEIRFLEPYQASPPQIILSSFQSVNRIKQGRISFSVNSTLNRLVLLGSIGEEGNLPQPLKSQHTRQSSIVE
jgi:hypothetical protein